MAVVSGSEQYVGLVLVSHSAEIANGLAGLVAQVAGAEVPVIAAGGMPDGSFGCDGGEVLEAIRAAGNGAGAVVLMDLGSSVLAVRAALAELEPAQLDKIFVADAPLVEGALAAAVAAAIGEPAEVVARTAEEARSAAKL